MLRHALAGLPVSGVPQPYAGVALQDARKLKERVYPEFRRSSRCRLVVLAIEVGGRWSHEAA